jgi:putative endonuclease
VNSEARSRNVRRGRWAEWLCQCVFMVTGWRVLGHSYRNKRGSRAGEIDLIARRGSVLAFIEVKARSDLVGGLNAVSSAQMARIARGAEAYMAAHADTADCDVRFDVMVVRPRRWPRRYADAWRPTENRRRSVGQLTLFAVWLV